MPSQNTINELNFPITLRKARERAGLSQRELGEKAGVNYSQISRYEQGIALPRPGMLLKLAEALDVSPEYLRAGDDLVHVDLIGDADQRLPITFSRTDMDLILELAAKNGRTFEAELLEMIRAGLRAATEGGNPSDFESKPSARNARPAKGRRPFELHVEAIDDEQPKSGKG